MLLLLVEVWFKEEGFNRPDDAAGVALNRGSRSFRKFGMDRCPVGMGTPGGTTPIRSSLGSDRVGRDCESPLLVGWVEACMGTRTALSVRDGPHGLDEDISPSSLFESP